MKISMAKLDLIMAQKNISTVRLAETSGISRQNISTIKHRGTCQPLTAFKLAQGLGVDVQDIIEVG